MTDSKAYHYQRGNAFIYVLIAMALFAGLSLTVANMGNDNNQSNVDQAFTEAAVNSMLSYAAAAQNTLEQMELQGANINDIDFILPSEAAFNTAPTINKLFHPDGGGLNYKTFPPELAGIFTGGFDSKAYYIDRFNNIGWTPTIATDVPAKAIDVDSTEDVIFTAYNISAAACAAVNKKLTGSTTIPSVTGAADFFVEDRHHGGSNDDFTATDCASCEGKPALCVNDSGLYVFYSIISAR